MVEIQKVLKRRSKLSVTYLVGDVLTNGFAFILLPVYARFLSPEDFGIVAIINVVRSMLVMVMSFGLNNAVMRFYYQSSTDRARKELLGVIWAFLLFVPAVGSLLIDTFAGQHLATIIMQVEFDPYIRFTVWIVYLQTAFFLFPLAIFRAKDEAKKYVTFNVIFFVLTSSLTVLFIGVSQAGARGVILARLISSIIFCLAGAIVLVKETHINFRIKLLSGPLRYSLPLIPHVFGFWVLNMSDRIILDKYVPIAEIGVYSIGYQFGIVYRTVVTSINSGLMSLFSRASNQDDNRAIIPKITTYYILIITTLALVTLSISNLFVDIFLPQSYQYATEYIPFIVLGYYAMGLYYVPMNVISLTVGRTKAIPVITLLVSGSNILLNLLLIPKFGTIAAAINTAISFTLLALVMQLYSQRLIQIKYETGRVSKIFLSGLISYSIWRILLMIYGSGSLIPVVAIVLIFCVLIGVSGFFNEWERKSLKKAFSFVYSRQLHR